MQNVKVFLITLICLIYQLYLHQVKDIYGKARRNFVLHT